MGVNLSGVIQCREVDLSFLSGKKVTIDAYNTIYQFLSIIRQPDGYPLCDSKNRITSHLSGLLYRTANLIESGIEPSFVFDGVPHELKHTTLERRRSRRDDAEKEWEKAIKEGDIKKAFSKAQQTSRITDEIRTSSLELLELMGMPLIKAPSDGEAQAAYMCSKGDVWASASQDYDSILFGAPRLVRNMTITGRRKMPGRDEYRTVRTEMIESEEALQQIGLTREQLVDACIMMGTDFNPGISGIGPKRGIKLIRDHGSLEAALRHIGEEIPEYREVREIFLDGEYTDTYNLVPGDMDRDGIVEMLTGYDFTESRVISALDKIDCARSANKAKKQQKSLDSWF